MIETLINDNPLAARYRDHALTSNWVGCRECHLKPDLLLIYKPEGQVVKLMRVGSHSNLFR
ncbi:MAG: type II toxin-antitoxin system YafQ family toxin [Verrucomicrobiota bacterium]|nr:type II toxin-antitoxin system YafQ family toxin [Verrucomicrobiota bacterium]